MKNIQTGNPVAIAYVGDMITVYSETWNQGDTRYQVIASTKVTGRAHDLPCECDFSYDAICFAAPKDSSTSIVGITIDHESIDEALSELEDCLKGNDIKWHAPQTLGI